MEKVYFVTSNPGKVESLKNIFKRLKIDFELEQVDFDYPEDKSEETTSRVALSGAKWVAKRLGKPVLVNDTGIFIRALGGFPGVNTSFALSRIGTEGILKLMEGIADRKVSWITSFGYCEPEGEPVVFTASLSGDISEEKRGTEGFGFDDIFIPEGESVTFAEDIEMRDRVAPLNSAIMEFAEWYGKKKRSA